MQPHDIAIPVLPSRSLRDTVAFYRRLGFEGAIHTHGDCAILTRGSVELDFLTLTDLDPATKIWGMREFAVVDADGNLVRIGQKLER